MFLSLGCAGGGRAGAENDSDGEKASAEFLNARKKEWSNRRKNIQERREANAKKFRERNGERAGKSSKKLDSNFDAELAALKMERDEMKLRIAMLEREKLKEGYPKQN